MTTTVFTTLPSPLGDLLAIGRDGRLCGLYFPEHHRGPLRDASWAQDPEAFGQLAAQLGDYLAGDRRGFDLELELTGTPFQREVWAALRTIPYGQVETYGGLAAQLGRPTGARAVASAVARNPVSIVVPCHRVVGSHRDLTGYAGGIERKRWLLELEGVLDPTLPTG
jgi:methylated-DNA-[protein]-cysteine S-methyltransferase